MDAATLIQELETLGVTLATEGADLVLHPASRVPPDMVGLLRTNKALVMQALVACHCNPVPGPAGCNPDKHTRCGVCGYIWECKVCGGCRRCRTTG